MVLWSLVPLFVICSGFEEITNRFDTIDIYQECDWYKFLPKVQRMIPFIIANAQESTGFKGYANISCTRDTFKRVILSMLFELMIACHLRCHVYFDSLIIFCRLYIKDIQHL